MNPVKLCALALILSLAVGCDTDRQPTPAPPAPPMSGGMLDTVITTAAVSGEAGTFEAAGLVFAVPASWQAVPPSTTMRLVEYRLPGEAGDAELTVFAFPSGQGGSITDNLNRWAGQFKTPDGKEPESKRRTLESNGLKVYVVQTEGTYAPTSMGPMAPKKPAQAGQALYGLIVEGGPQGNVFVKVAGPKATVDRYEEDLNGMASKVRTKV